MADESKDLLTALTESRLPALPSYAEKEPEPREPEEPGETPAPGKEPDEVVTPREEPPKEDKEETALPAGKRTRKAELKKYPIRERREDGQYVTVEYTAKELEEKGLLDNLTITSGKYSQLQDKYNRLLEKVADDATAPAARQPQEVQQPPPQVTNASIAQAYDQTAEAITQDLLGNKLLEQDLVDAWPRTIKTLVGQIRFLADHVFTNKAQADEGRQRLEQTIEYLRANAAKIEGQSVENDLNRHLDALAAKDPKLFGGLKDQKTRANFINYLAKEIGASKEQAIGPKAPQFLAKQYIAFNSDAVLDAAKAETANRNGRADKRFVTGEGSGTRPASPGESTMLDRMIDNSGRIQH